MKGSYSIILEVRGIPGEGRLRTVLLIGASFDVQLLCAWPDVPPTCHPADWRMPAAEGFKSYDLGPQRKLLQRSVPDVSGVFYTCFWGPLAWAPGQGNPWPGAVPHGPCSLHQEVFLTRTQLYLRTFFILFLSPLPPGGPGRVRTVIFLRRSRVLGPIPARIRGGAYFCLFGRATECSGGLERSWDKVAHGGGPERKKRP